MIVSSIASIGRIAPTAIPLQADTTVGIAAAIVLSLTVFSGVMVYLAFGPHNTVLQDDETPTGRSAASEPSADSEHNAGVVQGQSNEPTTEAGSAGGESDGTSST